MSTRQFQVGDLVVHVDHADEGVYRVIRAATNHVDMVPADAPDPGPNDSFIAVSGASLDYLRLANEQRQGEQDAQ